MIDISKVGTRIGNTDDLPEEIKKQLTCVFNDMNLTIVLDALIRLEGMATSDEILVDIYRNTKKVISKKRIYTSMDILGKKDLVKKVYRGVYKLKKEAEKCK